MNIQFFSGNLGKDPETKTVADTTVTKITVACGERWKDKDGNKQEKTEWIEVSFWGQSGETLAKFFKKGDGIVGFGKTETRTYEEKGEKKYYRSVRGSHWEFPPGRKQSGESSGHHDDNEGPGAPASSGDDIPF